MEQELTWSPLTPATLAMLSQVNMGWFNIKCKFLFVPLVALARKSLNWSLKSWK
jgi:hypothetical protein